MLHVIKYVAKYLNPQIETLLLQTVYQI